MLQHTDEQPVNFGAAAGGTAPFVAPQFVTAVRFVAHRELRLMLRGRLSRAIFLERTTDAASQVDLGLHSLPR